MSYSYNCVELKKVLVLVNENKEKLYISKSEVGSYPIDSDQVKEVRNNIRKSSCLTEEEKVQSLMFFNRLISVIRYVNFDEYLSKIINICQEIKTFLLTNHNRYNKIFFGGYGKIFKSYTWVLFLFLNELSSFFTTNSEITNKIFIGDDKLENTVADSNKYLYLFFDDMSYSGTQMVDSIPTNEKSINIDIYITAPFISFVAKEKLLRSNLNVKFWENIELVPKLETSFLSGIQADQKDEYQTIFNNVCRNHHASPTDHFYQAYQCMDTMIPIYLDHKIADGISTFQKLIYFGTYPMNKSCDESCIRTPLIKKCVDNNRRLYAEISYCSQFIADIDDDNTCPQTFYKKIIYNFKTDTELIPDYNEKNLVDVINYYDSIGKFLDVKYKQKYLKYKIKYLNLKRLLGGYDINVVL